MFGYLGVRTNKRPTTMHQTIHGTLRPVFTSRQLLLASTSKPITPFGGLVSLIEFFNTLKRGEVLGRLMPFAYTSPNAILPEQTLLAYVLSCFPSSLGRGVVWAGDTLSAFLQGAANAKAIRFKRGL
jgi:hypothetical protein